MRSSHSHPLFRDREDSVRTPRSRTILSCAQRLMSVGLSRLQLQGELQSKGAQTKQYKGVFHGVKVILQKEGPRGLFRGIGTAVRYMDRIGKRIGSGS